ncbi:MAG TPA: sigma-70 family RNA polymerase sigma factor [Acidimicrobiales bacterium]|nr:sigma-70 family RNA polymerase sigma factor [Acidimicrobiales bacterium]
MDPVNRDPDDEPGSGGRHAREAAFARYVVPELDVLWRVALSLTGHGRDAEDLVQDTLLRAYRAIESFDGAHPRAWLLTILRNAHTNRGRRQRPAPVADPGETTTGAFGHSRPPGPEDLVVGATFDTVVGAAFASLPTTYRRAVELVDIDGLSYGEAARALGIPEGTVMSRLHRGRKRIRAQLVSAGLAPRRRWR